MKKSKDYAVGYGRPPRASQFKPGNTEHLKRKKKKKAELGPILLNFLNASVKYRERGKAKRARRIDLQIWGIGSDAIKGDVGAADLLLNIRDGAGVLGEMQITTLVFSAADGRL